MASYTWQPSGPLQTLSTSWFAAFTAIWDDDAFQNKTAPRWRKEQTGRSVKGKVHQNGGSVDLFKVNKIDLEEEGTYSRWKTQSNKPPSKKYRFSQMQANLDLSGSGNAPLETSPYTSINSQEFHMSRHSSRGTVPRSWNPSDFESQTRSCLKLSVAASSSLDPCVFVVSCVNKSYGLL